MKKVKNVKKLYLPILILTLICSLGLFCACGTSDTVKSDDQSVAMGDTSDIQSDSNKDTTSLDSKSGDTTDEDSSGDASNGESGDTDGSDDQTAAEGEDAVTSDDSSGTSHGDSSNSSADNKTGNSSSSSTGNKTGSSSGSSTGNKTGSSSGSSTGSTTGSSSTGSSSSASDSSAVTSDELIEILKQESTSTSVEPEGKSQATSVVNSIITSGMGDFDKVKAIHDWLIVNVDYDYSNHANNSIPATDRTVSGVLTTKWAVCEGYAKTFKMMCDIAGVDCLYVTGTGNGGGHAWNQVKVEGNWYNIDVTWDDPVGSVKSTMKK